MKRIVSGILILVIVLGGIPSYAGTIAEDNTEVIGDTIAGAIIGAIASVLIQGTGTAYFNNTEPFSFVQAIKDGVVLGCALGFIKGVYETGTTKGE